MFKRGGIDEVCSLLVLVAQEQADQQANQAITDGPDQATNGAEMPGPHTDDKLDVDGSLGEGTYDLHVDEQSDTRLQTHCKHQNTGFLIAPQIGPTVVLQLLPWQVYAVLLSSSNCNASDCLLMCL